LRKIISTALSGQTLDLEITVPFYSREAALKSCGRSVKVSALVRSPSSEMIVAPVASDEEMLVKYIMVVSIRNIDEGSWYKTGTFEPPRS
jgi:hypothetical protein